MANQQKRRSTVNLDPRTIELIEKVVYDEARGEGRAGRDAVRAVIYNRMAANRPDFGGNTVQGVLNKRNQFQGVWQKARGNAARLPLPKDARNQYVEEHLEFLQTGVDPTNGATFFLNKQAAARPFNVNQKGIRIGRHEFFDNYNGNKVSVPEFEVNLRGFRDDPSKVSMEGTVPIPRPESRPTQEPPVQVADAGESSMIPYTGPTPGTPNDKNLLQRAFAAINPFSSPPSSSSRSEMVPPSSGPQGPLPTLVPYKGPLPQSVVGDPKQPTPLQFNAGGMVGGQGSISAPPQNRLLGRISEILRAAEQDSGPEFLPKQLDVMGTVRDVFLPSSRTVEKLSYGDPLFRMPTQSNIPITADKEYLAETVGMVPLAAPAAPIARSIVREAATTAPKGQISLPLGPVDDTMEALAPQKDAYETLGLTPEKIKAWQDANRINQRQPPVPEVKQAALDLRDGKITSQQYRDVVRANQPINPFTEVPPMPSLEDIASALKENQVKTGVVGVNKEFKDGEKVASRLDIPAYNTYDTWIVSLHDGTKAGGNAIGYAQTAVLKNVEFKSSPKAALNIATQKTDKSTIARIFGEWKNEDPIQAYERAKQLMNDPEWVQVGMNPYRHSYFYDKADMNPVVGADEIIQVGPLVLAKGVKKVSPDDPMFKIDPKDPASPVFSAAGVGALSGSEEDTLEFNTGGMVMKKCYDGCGMMGPDEFMMGYEEMSGNPIPMGSTAQEVADDIPALLSEGEFVLPADVVRYHGLKQIMEWRDEAKMGLMSMYMEGQIKIPGMDDEEEDSEEEESGGKGSKKSAVSAEEGEAEEGEEELPEEYTTPEGNVVGLASPEIEIEMMEVEEELEDADYYGDKELIVMFKKDPSLFKTR